jgi:hypothetical protein
MISFDQFKNEWLGRIIDFDHVYKYQCVDLILQYAYECYDLNGGISGNAIDYWVKTGINGFNQNLLNKFNKIPNTDAQKGDIVIFNGLSGNPYGHIGIATGNINATDVEILEQNGATGSGNGTGGDAIRVRYVGRNRVAGLLRPIQVAAAPAPEVPSGNTVHLPASVASWAVYRVGSALRKGTTDQLGSLAPSKYGGLNYPIVSWVGDYAVVIDTESYGRVALWVKGTSATFSDSLPEAPAPSVEVHPYTIETITPKQVRFNKATHRWGLNYDNFTAINNNPEGNVDENSAPIGVVAILHHNIGYNYYLQDVNVASGYNVVDCDDYTPPLPPPVKSAPPAGALSAPSTEPYEVISEVTGYTTSNQAINRASINNAKTVQIPIGTYFPFNKRFDPSNNLIALNITKTPGTPGAWINPVDNVPGPDPQEVAKAEAAQKAADEAAAAEAEKAAAELAAAQPAFANTYNPFPAAQLYVAMKDLQCVDLESKRKSADMPQYSVTWIVGTFTVNGVEYARPKSAADRDWWFGIEWLDPETHLVNLELESELFKGDTTLEDRQATKTLTTGDKLTLAYRHSKQIILGFIQLLSKIKASKLTK